MPPTAPSIQVLLASLSGTQIGFPADSVHEIVRAVAIAPLPGAPAIIEGAINLHGRIVPVVDVRRRLELPPEPLAPDQFLIALEARDRIIAVRVDDVEDVIEIASSSLVSQASVSPLLDRLEGIASVSGGALVVYDVNAFLTQAEGEALDQAAART